MNLSKVFWKYARNIILFHQKENTANMYKAFIQPLRYKNKMYLKGEQTLLGLKDQGHYLYIGPAHMDIITSKNDIVLLTEKKIFVIERAEWMYMGEEIIYIWAILRDTEEILK